MLKRITSIVAIAATFNTLGLVGSLKAETLPSQLTEEQAIAEIEKALILADRHGSTSNQTITEIVVSNPDSFRILTILVKAAGLADTLNSDGPFTVFAPTDLAFAKLPRGTLRTLLKEENKDTLVQILTYHVVSGKVTSKDIRSGDVDTVEGSPVMVKAKRGGRKVKVNNAMVIKADVMASNGVIHVIDKVLIPPEN
ncbi:MAG: fasciclin domain-containing protein [Prochloraceae cyanobacterium]|nr:fasciclin domain-containing protein [Prochloraceae cyanobacterium]